MITKHRDSGPSYRADRGHRMRLASIPWKLVEAAILERLEAVELFLADIVGRFHFARQLAPEDPATGLITALRDHLIPMIPSFSKRIWLASMDLARDSSGQIWFVDDHFCCPYGLHRMQTAISQGHVEDPITEAAWNSFLNAGRAGCVREHMESAVVLGPSTFNTVYAENRFIASWLGLPFVEKRELQLSSGELVRKSAGKEKPVALIMRRLQDEDLDPNSFPTGSFQGVRGLVRATRRGAVTVLNAPGTGLFNNRCVSRLIPEMIRFYLGREPSLPTVPTSVCDSAESFAAQQGDDYIFRTGNSMDLLKPLVNGRSSTAAREHYLRRVAAEPQRFVRRQTITSLTGQQSDAAFAIRTFCVGTTRRTVLRGGLRRSCYPDGTPTVPVTQERDATALPVSQLSVSS